MSQRWMVSCVLAAAVILFSGVPTRAQAPAPDEGAAVAQRLAALVLGQGSLDVMLDQAADLAMAAAAPGMQVELERELTPAEHETMRLAMRRAMAKVFPADVWARAFAPVYQAYFGVQDMIDLIAFYETPLGSRLLQLQGRLMAEGAAVGERLFQTREAEFVAAFERELQNALSY